MYRLLLLLIHLLLWHAISADQARAQLPLNTPSQPIVAFSQKWHSLGPFRIGTREAVWGSDPLEAIGGFKTLVYDDEDSFRSPLTPNATLRWTTHKYKIGHSRDRAGVQLHINYDNVDWTFQQQVYGWAALQYQTWVRGTLHNHSPHAVKVWFYSDGILEFYVNDQHFFGGDFFSFKRAPALILLEPGSNVFNIRLIRDVRAAGGSNPPSIHTTIQVKVAGTEPEIDESLATVPDIVDGKLPSRYLSVPIRNPLDSWIVVRSCQAQDTASLWKALTESMAIAPGQTRPFGIKLNRDWQVAGSFSMTVCYEIESASDYDSSKRIEASLVLNERKLTDASKFTFLHHSGAVSYAILKPPAKKESIKDKMPLLVLLHGAGLEADSHQVRHSLDGVPELNSFALFPTGMSPWSGDDWHLWGTADVLSAIDAVHAWTNEMEWKGVVPTTDRVVVVGHSNGGQGAWFLSTHLPDRIIAAAPLSAYTSIENYVSYSMWSEADPLKNGVVNMARSNYRHELLLGNLAQIHILQQHGSTDDNVPPYHSRLMSSLRSQLGMPSDFVELVDKPHWWNEALTTEPMQSFYKQHLARNEPSSAPTGNFSIVIPGCGSITSKFGIIVDQLQSPDRSGRVDVVVRNEKDGENWYLATTNIRRMHFANGVAAAVLQISAAHEETSYRMSVDSSTASQLSCLKEPGAAWTCSFDIWSGLNQRYGRQIGALDAILQSQGSFEIITCTGDIALAVQTSRNMLQYFGADTNVQSCNQYATALRASGNIILFASGLNLISSLLHHFPINIVDGDITLRTAWDESYHVIRGRAGIGIVFIRPLLDEKLELVVWGWDEDGLQKAARLIPSITGVGQPDFIVIDSKVAFQGPEGVVAMGFLDHAWNISKASYLP